MTGGASFIGSHLTEQLVKLGAKSSSSRKLFQRRGERHLYQIECETLEGDLLDPSFAIKSPREWMSSFIWLPTAGGDTSILIPWNVPQTWFWMVKSFATPIEMEPKKSFLHPQAASTRHPPKWM